MQFVYPGVLFGLLAISIPIIIHLFHFRRFKKIYFSDVSLLQQLSDQSKKQSRLKHLLVLAARILAIALLVLAFSKPFIPSDESLVSLEGNSVAVFVDNSFSMEGVSRRGRLIDEAVASAREIASIYGNADRFLLLTNDFEGRHQRFVSREEFLALLNEVDLSPTVRTIGEVIKRKNELFSSAPFANKNAYYISDFQKNMMVVDDARPDSTVVSLLVPLQPQMPSNLFIDSCWIETPIRLVNQPIELKVRIKNYGSQALENQPLRLYVNGQQRSIASFNIGANGQVEETLTWTLLEPGFQNGKIEIVDYPVTFDDTFYFNFEVASNIPVLSVDGAQPGNYLRALFGLDTIFSFASVPAFTVDASRFSQNNLIVLNGLIDIGQGLSSELKNFVEQGGNLAIFPSLSANINSYNSFLGSLGVDLIASLDTTSYRVATLNSSHPIYAGVFDRIPENLDLPIASQHFRISRTPRSSGVAMMVLQNGIPLISSFQVGRGNVFLSSVGLNDSFGNFHRHPLFVPSLANMALQGSAFRPLFHIIGDQTPILIPGKTLGRDEILSLKGENLELIPEQKTLGNNIQIVVHGNLNQAGNYDLVKGNVTVASLAFNFDRRESLPEFYTNKELSTLLDQLEMSEVKVVQPSERGIETQIAETYTGRQLWKFFLILALVFLLAEVLLLRFLK